MGADGMTLRGTTLTAGAAAALLVLTGCSTSSSPSAKTSSVSASTSSTSASTASAATPTTRAPRTYTVGEKLSAGEFAAELSGQMDGRTFQLATTGGSRKVTCTVTAGLDAVFSIRKPATGIAEMRVLQNMAYLEDKPGTAKPWFAFDMSSDQVEVPTQEAADALNLVEEVIAGDCRWNERLAAIDPSGTVTVTAKNAGGWTFAVPTDPQSQGDKNSDSARSYELGTWVVGKDGLPVSYRARDSSRVLGYSQWSGKKIAAPPADQVHQ